MRRVKSHGRDRARGDGQGSASHTSNPKPQTQHRAEHKELDWDRNHTSQTPNPEPQTPRRAKNEELDGARSALRTAQGKRGGGEGVSLSSSIHEQKEWLDAEIEAYLRKRDAMEELEGQLRLATVYG